MFRAFVRDADEARTPLFRTRGRKIRFVAESCLCELDASVHCFMGVGLTSVYPTVGCNGLSVATIDQTSLF